MSLLNSSDKVIIIFTQPPTNGAINCGFKCFGNAATGATKAEATCGSTDGVIARPPFAAHPIYQGHNQLITGVIADLSGLVFYPRASACTSIVSACRGSWF